MYLPSVEEISNLVDLKNANKIYTFLKGTNKSLNHMWLRDAFSTSPRDAMYLNQDFYCLHDYYVTTSWIGIRPAFVIDLSKIDYTEAGHVDYK